MNIDSSGPFSGTSFKANKPDLTSKASGTASAPGSSSRSASTGASARTAAPAAAAVTSAASTNGSVHAAAAQLLSTHGDFDVAKVAEIRASISGGRYVVNTERIADGLLASAQELLQSPQH